MEKPQYVKLCEAEFVKQTGIICKTTDEKGRPTLDVILPQGGLTLEDLSLLAAYFDKAEHEHSLLIDICSQEPLRLVRIDKLVRAMLWSSSREPPAPADLKRWINALASELPNSLRPVLETPRYQSFLKKLLPARRGSEDQHIRFHLELSHDVQRRMKSSEAFKLFMNDNSIAQLGPSSAYPPFLVGLQSCFSKYFSGFQNDLVRFIREDWKCPILDDSTILHSSWQLDNQLFDDAFFQVMFAPSGSGKTTSILKELTFSYGFYMVSSALRRCEQTASNSSSPNMLDPKIHQGVSRDTAMLRKMLSRAQQVNNEDFAFEVASELWASIFFARFKVFEAFQRAKQTSATPMSWLSFQLDCAEWDPFLHAFRVYAILSQISHEPWPTLDPTCQRLLHWLCIDEAQEDLRVNITSNRGRFKKPNINLLGVTVVSALATLLVKQKYENSHVDKFSARIIIAGTSLNMQKALDSIEHIRVHTQDLVSMYVDLPDPCKIVHGFPTVADKNDAKRVLQAYGIKAWNVLEEAAKHSVLLWGRIKWTSLYAEKIITKLDPGLSDSDTVAAQALRDLDLRGLAYQTFQDVVGHLVRRLTAIQQRGDGTELLNKLLDAAISADIRGLPHVFQHERDLELVDHGFAMVTTKIDRISRRLSNLKPKRYEVLHKSPRTLTFRLLRGSNFEDGAIDLLEIAADQNISIDGCIFNNFTSETAKQGLTIVDCMPFKMKTDQEREKYANAPTGRVKRQAYLKEKLSEGFDIDTKGTNYLLFAKLKPGKAMDSALVGHLQQLRYRTASMTIESLKDLMDKDLTITNPSLVASIQERVVIEASLRFFNDKLTEKLINSIKGVTSRTGLGHVAENFLAVQLRQYFAPLPYHDTSWKQEWQQRREKVLDGLAEAKNAETPERKIQDLSGHALVLGLQTVKKADSWKKWVEELKGWLTAIENDSTPSATFLLPHNDFGPDLLFALGKTGGDTILCSVQLKLGAGGADAVNKSSISWACSGRPEDVQQNADRQEARVKELAQSHQHFQTLEQEYKDKDTSLVMWINQQLEECQVGLRRAKNQIKESKSNDTTRWLDELAKQLANPFWKTKCRLSLLIAAGDNPLEKRKSERPDTRCEGKYEYYAYVSGTTAEALFGREFLELLGSIGS